VQEKKDFYKAVLITIDAAIAYAQRYADLAKQKAAGETNPKRKKELERIAEVCAQVPVNPARDWWEAVQSVWMMHVLITCELSPACTASAVSTSTCILITKNPCTTDKTMTHDEALELLECFWIHTNCTGLRSWDSVKILTGMGLGNNLTIGGQTREGKDACNDVTTLCLECDEELGILLPETGMRIWSGTPDKYSEKRLSL